MIQRDDTAPLRETSTLIRFDRLVLVCTGLVFLLLPTACGGGGSGGGSSNSSALPPTANPTPFGSGTFAGSSTTLADCARSNSTLTTARRALGTTPAAAVTAVPTTSYALTSNPVGASVSNNGTALGVTPYTFTPPYSSTANFIAFTSGSSNYTLCLTQSGYISRTILFNAAGDTSGSISGVATSSFARSTQSSIAQSVVADNVVRHSLRHAMASDTNPNEILVKYKSAMLQSENRSVLSIESAAGAGSARNLGPQDGATLSRIVRVPQGQSAQAFMQKLSQTAEVDSVYPVHYRSTLALTPVTPNDPSFTVDTSHQWDLYQIQMPNAWAISTGNSALNIAVIDTGYDPNNLDMAGKVTYSESDISGTTSVGGSSAQDTDGHGTNVSGIAAADTNNGVSVAGTGYNVSLQEYRIFPNPNESAYNSGGNGAASSDEAQAIYDAVANNVKVISLSIGGVASSGIDQSEYDAVEYAISKGITVVCAAGNERLSGVNTIDFPAAYPGVIAVGASALSDSVAPNVRTSATEYVAAYSNSGPGLALVAPGGDPANTSDSDYLHWILNLDTTMPATTKRCSMLNNCLALFAGTSQATPHVSGAAALLYSVNPNLTTAQVRSILINNADNINDPRQGGGRLNVYRALASVSGAAAPAASNYGNFVAFGYTNTGGTTPTIVDVTFPSGVPVNTDGTFRIPDIAPATGAYKIAVWSDVNGDGVIDAGDYFGVASAACTSTASCSTSAFGITVHPVSAGFSLP